MTRPSQRKVTLDMGNTSLYVGAVADFGKDKGLDKVNARRLGEVQQCRRSRKKRGGKNAHRLRFQSIKFVSQATADLRHRTFANYNVTQANDRWRGCEVFRPSKESENDPNRWHEELLAHRLRLRGEVRQRENSDALDKQRELTSRRRRQVLEKAVARITDSVPTLVVVGDWALSYIGPDAKTPTPPVREFLETLMRDPNAVVVFIGEQYTSKTDAFTENDSAAALKRISTQDQESRVWGILNNHEGHHRRRDEVAAANMLFKVDTLLEDDESKRETMRSRFGHRLFASWT